MTHPPIPQKASQFLRLVMADFELCENDPQYTIDMGRWHEPVAIQDRVECHVCLAGSFLAKTCKMPIDRDFFYGSNANGDLNETVRAINYIRLGKIVAAARYMDMFNVKQIQRHSVTPYEADKDAFKRDMFRLIERFEQYDN